MTAVVKKDSCRNSSQIIMRVKKVHIRCLTLKLMMKLSHKNRKLKKILCTLSNARPSKNSPKHIGKNKKKSQNPNQRTPNQNKLEINQGSTISQDFSLVHWQKYSASPKATESSMETMKFWYLASLLRFTKASLTMKMDWARFSLKLLEKSRRKLVSCLENKAPKSIFSDW